MNSRTKAILSLSGIFLLGAVIGAAIVALVVRSQVRDAQRLHEEAGFRQYFTEQLQLSETQRDSIRQELERAYVELEEFRRAAAEEYHDLLESINDRISPMLTPEQREILDNRTERLGRRLPPRSGRRPHFFDDSGSRRGSPPSGARGPASVAPGRGQGRNAAPPLNNRMPPQSLPDSLEASVDSTSLAQSTIEPTDPGRVLMPFVERLREDLELTDEQTITLRHILAATRGRLREDLREHRSYPHLQRQDVIRNLRTMEGQISAMLTDEQRRVFDDRKLEIRNTMREHLSRIARFRRDGRRNR